MQVRLRGHYMSHHQFHHYHQRHSTELKMQKHLQLTLLAEMALNLVNKVVISDLEGCSSSAIILISDDQLVYSV